MTCRIEAPWDRRLKETTITVGRDVCPGLLVDRYDVTSRDDIVELTKEVARVMIDRRGTQIRLDELDAAEERLGVSTGD